MPTNNDLVYRPLETNGTAEIIPIVTLSKSEYAELVAKSEKLQLIEKALDTTLSTFQIKMLFFSKEGEL